MKYAVLLTVVYDIKQLSLWIYKISTTANDDSRYSQHVAPPSRTVHRVSAPTY